MTNKEFVLSPSSLNLFLKEPALWVMKHFYGLRGSSNIYTIRGKLVEDYVNICLTAGRDAISFDEYFDECKKKSEAVLNIIGIPKPYLIIDGVEVTKSNLEDFYKWGQYAYSCLPSPKRILSKQDYVSRQIEGVELGGYIDYYYEPVDINSASFNLDLKTCNKLPIIVSRGERKGMISKSKVDNIRQQVIYIMVTDIDADLLYVTPTESLRYRVTQRDIEEVTPSIKEGIKNIKNLLTMGKEYAIINTELGNMGNPFMWTDTLKSKAKSIWRL